MPACAPPGGRRTSASLRRFSTYLGEGFQIRNDLDDWQRGRRNKRKRGLDVLAGRPPFCAPSPPKARMRGRVGRAGPAATANSRRPERVDRVRELYCRSGAFAKAEQLFRKLRDRASTRPPNFLPPISRN